MRARQVATTEDQDRCRVNKGKNGFAHKKAGESIALSPALESQPNFWLSEALLRPLSPWRPS